MKIVLALAAAIMLLAVPAPIALADNSTDSGVTVYISVSVDGKLLLAAQPVTVTEMTVDGAIKAAHAKYYPGGESGYTAGIDPFWNMYLISQCWGVRATPFVILNGAPLGANPVEVPPTVDACPIVANDNIIICTSSDPFNRPAQPVSLMATITGDSTTVTAIAWTLDFTTFTYSSAPLANANVIDPITGTPLGITDADGHITVIIPQSSIVAIEGLAAINVRAAAERAAPPPSLITQPPGTPAPGAPAPTPKEVPLLYGPTISLMVVGAIILTPIIVIVIIKMMRQARLDKVPVTPKDRQ